MTLPAGVARSIVAAGVAAALAGCTSAAPASTVSAPGTIAVRAADDSCQIAAATAPAGKINFSIANTGTKVTEFYFYGPGDRIMGEVENIGPGLTRQLIVEVPDGGTYTTACKPGMVGDGIRAPFAVTGAAIRSVDENTKLAEATAGWKRYVGSQVDALVLTTGQFADAVKHGDVAGARSLYPVARTYFERIEPVAASFGDLDPRLDGREDDQRDPGVPWTGFHRLEKELWVTGLSADAPSVADRLVADTVLLQNRAKAVTFTPVELANGAKTLLDEVATGKITGEEEHFSHTDLWDFKANVEGSQGAIAALRPVIDDRNTPLGPMLDARFTAVNDLLANYRVGDGYRLYTALTPGDTKKMSQVVDALAEPVSQVAAIVSS